MMRKTLLMAAVTAMVMYAPIVSAAEVKPKQTDIESDSMEIIDAEKKAVFTGNVRAIRGDTVLTANQLTVLYDEIKQPDGTTKHEPRMDAKAVGDAVAYMASLPLEANILNVTVMATAMPFVGRG